MTKRRPIPKNVIRDVEPHLTSTPTLPDDIAKRVGCWAPKSIRDALDCMVASGQAAKIVITDQRGYQRQMFFKAEAT